MDVVAARADPRRVLVGGEDIEELEGALGGLNGDDISVEAGNVGEDGVEVRVAEVGVGLGVVTDASSCEAERVDSPGEVGVPVDLAEGQTLTDGRLVDLDGEDASLLKVADLVTEGKSKLHSLGLLVNVGTRERPVENGDRASEHALDRLAGKLLGVAGPADGHRAGAGHVGNDNGGTNVARAVRLDPGVLGEDETSELLAEVLDHVVTLGLAMD